MNSEWFSGLGIQDCCLWAELPEKHRQTGLQLPPGAGAAFALPMGERSGHQISAQIPSPTPVPREGTHPVRLSPYTVSMSVSIPLQRRNDLSVFSELTPFKACHPVSCLLRGIAARPASKYTKNLQVREGERGAQSELGSNTLSESLLLLREDNLELK